MTMPARASLTLLSLVVTLMVASSCTITGTINRFLSSTTPGSWYDQDGSIKAEYKAVAFVALNFENVKQDMAQGKGEYLTALGRLLGVSAAHQEDFAALAQERAQELVSSEWTTPEEVLAALERDWPAAWRSS